MKLSMDQQDFELYLLLYVQEKSRCICLNLETEAKIMIIVYVFSILDMAIYSLRKPLDWDSY